MRQYPNTLGERLGSTCLRYRRCAEPGSGPRGGMPFWRRLAERRGPESGATPALSRLEAVLFLARAPLASRRLAQLANLADGTQARSLVRRLRKLYDTRGAAFQVEEVAGGFQIFSRRQFAPWLRRLAGAPQPLRLSGPAMETLAVVAYRQPVLRAEIEAIRGVQSGEILRQLMERDLVRIAGRGDELGRPFLYGTTKRFLQLYGLRHVDELPRAENLRTLKFPAAEAVASLADERDDMQSSTNHDSDPEEESEVASTEFITRQEREQLEAEQESIAVGAASAEDYAYQDDDDVEEDDFDDEEDDDDEDEEDDEEDFDDEDEDEEDLDEDDEDDDEDEDDLEGDWEEVEDDEEDEDEDDDWEDDEDDEDEEEDWEEED